jgi:beta-fructofuranosidase
MKSKKRNYLLGLFLAFGWVFPSLGQADRPPFKSPVPKYEFSNDGNEQLKQLQDNPLMLRFKESRRKLANDPHRPIFHFISPESTMNDPNGLCFWNGNWHLFYQAYPPEDRRQHWGHAYSEDLINWKDLPYAIYPSPERAVFSGTTLVEENRVIAMYHGTEVGNMVAVSEDPLLLNWEKVSGGAVIPIKSKSGFPLPYSVFDPSIWKHDDVYYSLSAGRTPKGPGGRQLSEGYLFRSKNLIDWDYLHPFVENDIFTLVGDDYACPYFWPIGDRYIMPFFSHMSGGQYLLGDYDTDKNKFMVTHGGKFNFGPANPSGVHAPSSAPDGEGNVIVIFNMNPGKPTGEWNQIMTLPRKLTLSGDSEILQEPAGNIESIRGKKTTISQMVLKANQQTKIKGVSGNAMELNIEIDLKKSNVIELNVLESNDKQEFTRIIFFKDRGMTNGRDYRPGEVFIPIQERMAAQQQATSTPPRGRESLIVLETTNSSIDPEVLQRAPETASFYFGKEEILHLRVFIDKSVVEVFVNGKQALAARVYPKMNNSLGVSLKSQGSDSELLKLEAWQMKSIYDNL